MTLVIRIPAAVVDIAAATLDAVAVVRLIELLVRQCDAVPLTGTVLAGVLVALAGFPVMRWTITSAMAGLSRLLPGLDLAECED